MPFGEGEGVFESACRAVVDGDCPAERHDGVFDDGESESCAAEFARASGVDAVEAVEEAGDVAFVDSDAVVGEAKDVESIVFGDEVEADFGAAGVGGGIFDESAEHVVEQCVVACDFAADGDVECEFHVAGEVVGGEVVGDTVGEVVDVDAVEGYGVGGVFEACDG